MNIRQYFESIYSYIYSTLLEKYPNFLVDFNQERLHEAILNFHTQT
jgi:hypothetical protein